MVLESNVFGWISVHFPLIFQDRIGFNPTKNNFLIFLTKKYYVFAFAFKGKGVKVKVKVHCMKRRLKRSRQRKIAMVYSSFACRCKPFDQLRRLLRLEEIKDYGLNQKDESVAELSVCVFHGRQT